MCKSDVTSLLGCVSVRVVNTLLSLSPALRQRYYAEYFREFDSAVDV